MSRIKRISKNELQKIIESVKGVSTEDQAEMAIPSYLNKNPFIRALFWRRYDAIHRMTRLQKNMHVCEFGCGIGIFLPTLAEETRRVYAVDIFPQYAMQTAKNFGLDIIFSKDLTAIPDHSLDLVIASEVMEHLDDPADYAQRFALKLKPGGRLIISGPTESWLYKLGRFLVGYNKYHDYHAHNIYQLRQIVTKHVFDEISHKAYPAKVFPLYLICEYNLKN